MWRITIIANAVMMILFWLISVLSVSIADNRFVQYAKGPFDLPVPTKLALSMQLWIAVIPLLWIILSYLLWQKVKAREPESRTERLLAFTSSTLAVGFAMVVFFMLAGILPFLYIK
ncbi:MAG: hypothetical protein JRJ35_13795 [Deltaproteobacteria bacterium]|nr:hypothetical protein [Deltaproteobacteria bacterium]MBW1924537.1 hypothetical protein [Deltaproteobacteria bacterium]MBW1950496.1 hypothetical protein [Deltaproteobacteria bacterium]MBW2009436.1 hypothetical protein [Deltaproteobacteria bacterium]